MPLKILLADDHLVLLAGMRALLEREGYQVVADVSDGRQAVNLARRLQPHIAVLDITMPGLNGLAAAQKIRRLCPETKVIILTMSEVRRRQRICRTNSRPGVWPFHSSSATSGRVRRTTSSASVKLAAQAIL